MSVIPGVKSFKSNLLFLLREITLRPVLIMLSSYINPLNSSLQKQVQLLSKTFYIEIMLRDWLKEPVKDYQVLSNPMFAAPLSTERLFSSLTAFAE